jgi:hypothetical protein
MESMVINNNLAGNKLRMLLLIMALIFGLLPNPREAEQQAGIKTAMMVWMLYQVQADPGSGFYYVERGRYQTESECEAEVSKRSNIPLQGRRYFCQEIQVVEDPIPFQSEAKK